MPRELAVVSPSSRLNDPIELTTLIATPPQRVWAVLTEPALMIEWLGEPEMRIEVAVDWTVGGPIRIAGYHHANFENKGSVLALDPPTHLRYSHLSSLSRLPDKPENHTVFDFDLTPEGEGTRLVVRVSGFPTRSIYKHLEFYWRGTMAVIRRVAEAG